MLIRRYNEAMAIPRVVEALCCALPNAAMHIHDNSTDKTAPAARAAGATVRTERQHGLGRVVRRRFAGIEADL
ncbi:hypothetical protein ACFQS7_08315 [Dankookia sp. GCM10030260]|uniref:hypothetical protein n=1 Tax=Dankookia sp. GCM10030260 TaxID=3273390 RepID=UPI00360A7886